KRLTQLVFCDFSRPDPTKFNVYDDVKAKLIERGIPKKEIAFIHDANTDVKKLVLFKKVNEGSVRVLMGSTLKMGEGMNVQKKLIALHDLDAPWNPSDIEQRLGRIVRQGNSNPEVEVIRYATEGSFDAYMWQTLETKSGFIGQIMKGQMGRSAEDITTASLTYAEMKAIASNNPKILEKVKVDAQYRKLHAMWRSWMDKQFEIDSQVNQLPAQIEANESIIEKAKQDIKTRDANTPADEKDWKISIAGKEYTDKKEAKAALMPIVKKIVQEKEAGIVAKYRGFPIFLSSPAKYFTAQGRSNEAMSEFTEPTGYASEDTAATAYLQRFDSMLNGLDERIA
ncbi:MAG: helicase, partial [candidate division Zixibacteria bacterium]|nr:helicase [candidate division Zixibacteria bacterium]